MNPTRPADPDPAGPGPAAPAPPVHEPPPPGAHAMNVVRWVLFAGLLVLAVLSIGGYVISRRGESAGTGKATQALYHCPMHPTYTSNKPGECPICGMDLEPIAHDAHAAATADGDVPGLVGVHLSTERIQMIGVRTAKVGRRELGEGLSLVAFVAPDESRLRRVQLRATGWVQKLHVSRTGETVAAGEPLLAIYSPELYQSEYEFLIELEAAGDSVVHRGPGAVQAGRERLVLLGVPAEEIARLERERSASARLVLRAPFSGTVLERGVVEGQYVGPDTPLLTLADLSRVWLLADVYEMDLTRVRVGDPVVFTAEALPGSQFEGRVEFVYPTVSTDTRTIKARIVLANPRGQLKPGMFGRAAMRGGRAPVLAVPSEAVVYTGEHHYVFIAHPDGHFEPRMVWVGLQTGDWVEIRRGLAEGETVVSSASFLIDSESRLKAAIAGMGAQPTSGHQH
ncbi:MAG: hypothetical protein A2W00_05695 [Candidatus Eisenbacteria bacterium RBG_16_71_46]|nr:MAG: hypothetical protein A2W00_05695 [Candidatus Eisenbacteria bacterium RBG_16_71_46]OGF21963.1 MAG: hypothetical protein A2V63_09185 [Candidatus Eisenbacteria bacterium RBG_19FT_COMBO_70_11]